MKIFILEERREVHIRIYGIDGEQHTKEFFDAVFVNMSCIYPTTEAEKKEYDTDSIYTFESRAAFNKFCGYLEKLQDTLDKIAEAIIEGDDEKEYGFEYANYIV